MAIWYIIIIKRIQFTSLLEYSVMRRTKLSLGQSRSLKKCSSLSIKNGKVTFPYKTSSQTIDIT